MGGGGRIASETMNNSTILFFREAMTLETHSRASNRQLDLAVFILAHEPVGTIKNNAHNI